MSRKRLVLLVEGDGEATAAPVLVKRLLAPDVCLDVILDPHPLKVGGLPKIVSSECRDWKRFLGVAAKRRDFGACLLLLDGDCKHGLAQDLFCAGRVAQDLAARAADVGAGILFSVAVVFACQEFESWLIAGASSLVGQTFADGRKIFDNPPIIPEGDLEAAPRDAKGWFRKQIRGGYNPPRDQSELARLVDLDVIRDRNLRSFQRLENATRQLVAAIRSGQHIVSPNPRAND